LCVISYYRILYFLEFFSFSVFQFFSFSANADNLKPSDQEFTLQGLYVDTDSDRGTDYGTGIRMSYGFRYGEHWWLEPQFFTAVLETDAVGSSDSYQQGLGADVSYRFTNHTKFDPYVLAGIGASRNDADGGLGREMQVFANVGAGVLTAPFTGSGLRAKFEVRYLFDGFNEGFSDFHVGIGIVIPVGYVRERIVEVERVVEVERIVYVEKPVERADSDKDGVIDGVDQCPNTLAGLKVDAVGCVAVDKRQSVVLGGVSFDSNSDRLTANARDILLPAIAALKGQPELKIEIAGHADDIGKASYNKLLSQKRADSVRNYFVELGVPPGQLVAKGYGEEQPLMLGNSTEARERNRRVEFNVVSQ
jgi:OOP family OmpA-OmpF porin